MAEEDETLIGLGEDFIQVMESFPCIFNVVMLKNQTLTQLKEVTDKLEVESREPEYFPGETVALLNVLTWLHFQAGNYEEAKKKNNESLKLNSTALDSLVALGNRAFLAWYFSADLAKYLQRLLSLKGSSYFLQSERWAKAEQAYLLFRLGGKYNLSQSINIYTDLVTQLPENYQWKYNLGIASRRLNVICREAGEKTREIFTDIANNAPSNHLKSLAYGELAALEAQTSSSMQSVIDLVDTATSLTRGCHKVYRNCGIALKKMGSEKAIELLDLSINTRPSSVAHHALGKCYGDYSITRSLNRRKCQLKAIQHLLAAYQLSKQNIQPLVDLIMLRNRGKSYQCLQECQYLAYNWWLNEEHQNPFRAAKTYEIMYQQQQMCNDYAVIERDRSLAIAICSSLTLYKNAITSQGDRNAFFDQIVATQIYRTGDKFTKALFHLLKNGTAPRCARQLLIKWKQQGYLQPQEGKYIEGEIEKLLDENMAYEALVVMDMLKLHTEYATIVSDELLCKTLVQEAESQLRLGLNSCKLLFHRLFDLRHGIMLEEPGAGFPPEQETPCVDVIILHDGPQWKPLFPANAGERKDNVESVRHCSAYENPLLYLCGLEVLRNPCLPFSRNELPVKFAEVVSEYKVKLVLVLQDSNTSQQFLQIVDSLLENTTQGCSRPVDAALILCEEGEEDDNTAPPLPCLSKLRRLRGPDCGMGHNVGTRPIEELQGVSFVEAYFLGREQNAMQFVQFQNAMQFVKFLMPPIQ